MTGEAGAPGTAGDRYKVEPPAGRHRAPPAPPKPDRFTVPLAAAAAILTAASLLAIAGQAVAPDASAAASTTTAPTASRTARTVHVPLTILPATPPSIGASGAWDPETDAPIPVGIATSRPQSFAGSTGTGTVPQEPSGQLVATTAPSGSTTATTAGATTIRPTTSTATRTTASTTTTTATAPPADPAPTDEDSATPTEEQPVPTTPTATETVPTDIGDAIDQALEDAIGETP